MDENDFKALAIVRLDRAKELYTEAGELVKMDSYKSANNRAFYAISYKSPFSSRVFFRRFVYSLRNRIGSSCHSGTLFFQLH